MRSSNALAKVLGILLVCLMLGSMGGGLLGTVAPTLAHAQGNSPNEVLGFLPYWIGSYTPKYEYLTHIAWFSVDTNSDGTITNAHGWPPTQLINEAHAHNVKVILTATCFNADSIDSVLAYYSATVSNNLLTLVQNANGDGVIIDFEGIRAVNKYTGGSNSDLLTQFMQILSSTFKGVNPSSYVSICLPAVDWSNVFNCSALSSYTDSMFIMAYDYHWQQSPTAGAVSPLEGDTYNVSKTVDYYLTLANSGKFILGLPLYGWDWSTQSSDKNSNTLGSAIAVTINNAVLNAKTYGRLWDDNTQTPWYRYIQNNVWHQCWFDDVSSLSLKYRLALQSKMGGIGFWALGDEGQYTDIYKAWNVEKGLQWLRDNRNQDGSWTYSGRFTEENVGLTAMATAAFLNHGIGESDPTVRKGLDWILGKQDPNSGLISNGAFTVYDTSLAIMALVDTGNSAYYNQIQAAAKFLIGIQNDESTGYTASDQYYGGWPYYQGMYWADLSNTQFALLALHYAENANTNDTLVPQDVWSKAETFVQRCQNLKASNPDWSFSNDGGFIYQPGSTAWAGGQSYASMTMAGLWGFYSTGVSESDAGVQTAIGWLQNNYHIDQNYPLGSLYTYYYLYGLAKACVLWHITAINGHDWYQEMASFLASQQQPDGHWFGTDPSEEPGNVATCWAILALETTQVPLGTAMQITLYSAADVLVTDPLGRHEGMNHGTGQVQLEIPGATYSGTGTEPQVVSIPDPIAGAYDITLFGTATGSFTLSIEGMVGGDVVSTASYPGSITPGQTYESTATVSSIAGPITIDTTSPSPPSNLPPIAEAGGPYTSNEGSPITFDASGSYDPDGTIALYEWDFDNNGVYDTSSTLPTATYTWGDEYTGNVTLRVTDNGGLQSVDIAEVTVSNVPPQANAGPHQTAECCTGVVQFNGNFTDPSSLDTHTIQWDFGDGATASGNLTPTHVYCATGDYTATLTVTDDDGGVGTNTTLVQVVDTTPPSVTIASPVQGQTYLNTQGTILVQYIVTDTCDKTPNIAVTLDGNAFTGDKISLCGMLSGQHTLMVSATDHSGNTGTASSTFILVPKAMKSFVIKNLAIQWAPHTPRWKGSDSFSIFGRLQLPQGYTWASLQNQATVSITIGGKSGNDTVLFKGKLYGKPQSTLWSYKGNEQPPGYGMNINNMVIWCTPQGTNWNSWAGFYVGGVLQLPASIGVGTTPPDVTITIEIPVTTAAGCGSLTGTQTVRCSVPKLANMWFYNAWPNLPSFPSEPTGRE
jgi:spore germination protein YaaH/PKD repeat protein